MPTKEKQTPRVNIDRSDPTLADTRTIHQGHHLFLSFDVEHAYYSFTIADEHEVLEQANALTDPVELVRIGLKLPGNLVVLFVEQKLVLHVVELLVETQELL